MMEDALLMGRFESGRVAFQPVTFDLASFCKRVRGEMETATNGVCPIQLQIKKLPANAVKYSAPGKLVCLSVSKQGDDAVFQSRIMAAAFQRRIATPASVSFILRQVGAH